MAVSARLVLASLLALPILSGCVDPAPPSDIRVDLERIASGFNAPIYATAVGGGQLLYVVEQAGVIRIVDGTTVRPTPFLDIRNLVGSGGERGLLGFAAPKNFPQSDRVYVHYTDRDGDTVLASYRSTTALADPATANVLLRVDQPYANHNGGMIAFGRDGFLYMGLGDGGSGGDPQGNGQSLETLLGKILRLDVSRGGADCPATNPMVGTGARCEIWAYGLRNPWRFSFDAQTGDLFIGDVGQNQWEEIDFSPASSKGGENYGWNVFEGRHQFRPASLENHVEPIAEYPTGPGGTCAVTGGYVYRGSRIPDLIGRYVFGDYCSGQIWVLERQGRSWVREELMDTDLSIASFGEDAQRELLIVDRGGSLHRLRAAP
jgi:glucose/arabinose dehydrogenase